MRLCSGDGVSQVPMAARRQPSLAALSPLTSATFLRFGESCPPMCSLLLSLELDGFSTIEMGLDPLERQSLPLLVTRVANEGHIAVRVDSPREPRVQLPLNPLVKVEVTTLLQFCCHVFPLLVCFSHLWLKNYHTDIGVIVLLQTIKPLSLGVLYEHVFHTEPSNQKTSFVRRFSLFQCFLYFLYGLIRRNLLVLCVRNE